MGRLFLCSLFGLLVFVAMPRAGLSATITYTSLPFNRTNLGEGRVEGVFTFSGSLEPGSTLTQSDVDSWSLSSLGRTIDSDTIAQADASLFPFFAGFFVIGDDGLPAEWAFATELNIEGNPGPDSITSLHATDTDFSEMEFGEGLFPSRFLPMSYDGFFVDDTLRGLFGASVDEPTASSIFNLMPATPGSWSLIPEPNTSVLLCLGIMALAFRQRHCRTTTAA